MKKKILNLLVVILTISIIFECIVYFRNTKENKVLKEVEEVNVFNNKDKTLSVMIQNEEEGDFGWHEAPKGSSWPDYKIYTYVGTECTDASGAKMEDTRQYVEFHEDRNTATITTNKTIYCTLYFAKGRPPIEVLTQYKNGANNVETFKTDTSYNGIYMYNGTYTQVTNNYICFGTTNYETCTASDTNKDKYLYRIIGITNAANTSLDLEAGQLKIIKATPSSTSQKWAGGENASYCGSSGSENGKCLWEAPGNTGNHSDVQIYLNGEFLNTIEETWQEVIDDPKWYIGDRANVQSNGTEITPSIGNYKVGLMYAGDYYNSWDYKTVNPSFNTPNTDSWLYISHGRTGVESKYKSIFEWTMTRCGYDSDNSYRAYYVNWEYGNLSWSYGALSESYAVRPAFYLIPEIGLVGEGTEEKPFIITSRSNA